MRFIKYSTFVVALSGTIAVLGALSGSTAAAQEPQFYPNAKYNSATVSQLRSDIQSCQKSAESFMQSQKTRGDNLRPGVQNAAKGAAAGALVGVITGQSVGRATGAGAAVGGLAGGARTLREQGANNPQYQKYATACLEERGYKVIGWK